MPESGKFLTSSNFNLLDCVPIDKVLNQVDGHLCVGIQAQSLCPSTEAGSSFLDINCFHF